MKNLFFVAFSLFSYFSFAGSIELSIDGIENNRGVLQVAIWKSSAGFPEDYRQAVFLRTQSLDNLNSIVFDDVPAGQYGVAVYHDENEDTVLNRGRFGIPKEGVGFSQNPRIRFGPPKFDKAKFYVSEEGRTRSNIRVRYP